MKRKSGFTLLELVVVIIIIAILASLGFAQYTRLMERGRSAEGRTILGNLRTAELAYYLEYNAYTNATGNLVVNGTQTACTENISYFTYGCDGTTGTCTATRCTANGKLPPYAAGYTMTLTTAGAFGGSGPP